MELEAGAELLREALTNALPVKMDVEDDHDEEHEGIDRQGKGEFGDE